MNNLKHAFAIAALALSSLASAQQLIPLDKWAAETPKWKKDLTEVAYIGARCGALNYAVGYYFSQVGNKQEDLQNGKKLIAVGTTFSSVALRLGELLGMSDKFVNARFEAFVKDYADSMAENKKLHNQIFMGNFKNDFNFCVSQYQLFKDIDDEMNKEQK